MPLMQGKSPKAFSKNVSTEMEHDKPQKQALAIAYAIKRRAQGKKMAQGGMADDQDNVKDDAQKTLGQAINYPGSDTPKPQKPKYMAQGGIIPEGDKQKGIPKSYPVGADGVPKEDESREHDPMHGEQTDGNEDLSPEMEPEMGAKKKMYAQYDLSERDQSHGQVPQYAQPYAPYRPGNPVHPANKIAQRKMPLSEQQAHLAQGGMVDATRTTKGSHYPGNPVHSYDPMGMYSQSKMPLDEQEAYLAEGGVAGLDEYPYEAPEEQGDHFASGGMSMMHPKGIAHGIMMKKMAQGGVASRPEDGDSIDNFGSEDHPDNDFLSDEEDTNYFNPNQADLREPDAKERRKSMLSGIMRNLQKKHYGT